MEVSILDDLIYSFLLQSNFPRASIVFDVDLLGPTAQVGSGMKVPSFVIVDPETADPLAVIEVVEALDADALKQVAIETGAYASRLAAKTIQGFVIRVDPRGLSEAQKIQFYRIWPNSTLQKLSTRNFPDIDALRVSRKLTINMTAKEVGSAPAASGLRRNATKTSGAGLQRQVDSVYEELPGAGLYVPALVLLLVMIADGFSTHVSGESFLTLSQSILAVGAAALLTLPSAIRYLRK
ncbi:MAG: hypothetical protein AB8B87_21655 [Granulosicoccus sp.]